MGHIVQPEWVDNYCIGKEVLSDCIERWRYTYQNEYGYIYICRPYPGIHLWVNDVHMHCIPTDRVEDYHFIKLNYCIEGRSEVLLQDERYVYLEQGTLSIDSNEPKASFLFPSGRYVGLELILDMQILEKQPVQALVELGIDFRQIMEWLSSMKGSYLATASMRWRELAEVILQKMKAQDGKIEDFRFYTLAMLYLAQKGNNVPVDKQFYVTKGQRMIVKKVEEKISGDLKCRYTVEQLAKENGVSPSSLKKYFEKVYGTAISDYIRKKRMEYACDLLRQTKHSVADIAAEVGYSNQGKFSSVFKKYTKKTPLEYRRLHRHLDTPENMRR